MPLLPAKRVSEASADEERSGQRGGSDDEDGGCGVDGSRKKLRLSKDQSAVLEDSFREHPTLNPVISLFLGASLTYFHETCMLTIHVHAVLSTVYSKIFLNPACCYGLRAEAEGSLGAAAGPAVAAGGGVVPEQTRKVRISTCNSIL